MTSKKKSWQEKLADKDNLPKILILEKKFPCYNAVHKMGANAGDEIVLVNPCEVVECMKKVPYGKITTIEEICMSIARKYHVKGCCSLTTGIFIMIAANAAEEAILAGKDLKIPYWRTVKNEGLLNEKYPGGDESHKQLLEKEGLNVYKKGKKYYVQHYHKYLFKEF